MSHSNETKTVTTRKNHKCFGCGKLIEKGTKCVTRTGTNDDGWWTMHLCSPCRSFEVRYISNMKASEYPEDYYCHPHTWHESDEYNQGPKPH